MACTFSTSQTSKSGPNLVCFVHFDFEMCFAPTTCNFSTSQLPKVVRQWCALYILTSKCASPLLSAYALVCFSSVHIVGSLTSKLPSCIHTYIYIYIFIRTHHTMTYISKYPWVRFGFGFGFGLEFGFRRGLWEQF